MKKLVLFAVAIFIAFSGFSQAYTGTPKKIKYQSLTDNQKKVFSQEGVRYEYKKLIKIKGVTASDIMGVFEVTGIPKSRGMVTDTTVTPNVTKPEFETQYMVIYNDEKGNKAVAITIDIGTTTDAASIASLLSTTGYKQGDDQFEADKNNYQSTKMEDSYDIGGEW